MGAHFDWTLTQSFTTDRPHSLRIGKMRAGPEMVRYKDPFVFSCAVTVFDDVCYFEAATSRGYRLIVDMAQIRTILRELGVRFAMYSREENGELIWRQFPV